MEINTGRVDPSGTDSMYAHWVQSTADGSSGLNPRKKLRMISIGSEVGRKVAELNISWLITDVQPTSVDFSNDQRRKERKERGQLLIPTVACNP